MLDPLVTMADYSTKRITRSLIEEVSRALKSIDAYGSVEIYVQNSTVTQITVRNIKKTNGFGIKKGFQKQ
ncbi:MAG: hypothetical protein A2900_02750 [Candidatus Chisholmbacteria bacterium RIFCSPLOWO2_01_FULL_50_28]|uniref:DUF2292 domain-containing protein n=1 Tax=Candidatus Chisholmbacteria bacterium RIFCSPHIGHO2_01_FULL_52_32 TaxID=1797591 RepID=A0A1G1VT92_9BACT|nr:MAG: hypothetical protein A2786_03995 [Candidatus Chisholmbacteria bacterium RIFCSPHIGHO2_01_FULL_52_32]OGY19996.1 MAG: hypothetical protein A2900_02750 [Candidatus Chisholmbacteria bacterium RIFCSPLOWO2_01_FULL_50_28]